MEEAPDPMRGSASAPAKAATGRAWWRPVVAAAFVLGLAVLQMDWTHWAAVGLMGALGLATGLFAFPVGKNTYVSFGAAVFIASTALFGPSVGVWVAAMSTAAVQLVCFRHDTTVAMREMGVQVVAVFAAGCAYSFTGGKLLTGGITFADSARFALMFGIYGAASVLVRRAAGGEMRRTVASYLRWMTGRGVVVELAMLPLALLLAAAYIPGEPATFPLLAVVLIVSSAAGKMMWDTKQSLEKSVTELRTLNTVGKVLSSTLKLNDLLEELEESTSSLFADSMCSVCLYHESTGEVEYRVNMSSSRRLPPRRRKPGDTLIGWVIRERAMLLVDDLRSHDGQTLDPWLAEQNERAGVEAVTWLGVPLVSRERLVGVLTILSSRPKAFGKDEVDLIVTLGSQVAKAIENASLYAGLEQSRTNVEEWNKELEEKVEERTAELEEMKAELEVLNRELEERVEVRTNELQEMEARVVQSGRLAAVGEMAAGVAHELNNPLGGILGYVQYDLEKILGKDGSPLTPDEVDKLAKHLVSIEKASQRCRGIVQSLLTFSQASQSAYSEINLNDVLSEALRVTGRQLTARGIRLTSGLDTSELTVLGDPYQLRQVFANLILNARDAMTSGDALTVRSIRTEDADGTTSAEAIFEDTGCGIAEENLVRVFEPFFTTRPTGEGTGLGLSVSYGIIKDHGGQIEVASQVDKGTIFTVRLPLVESRVQLEPVGGAK
jgi:signal transduction histidine kinase